MVFVPRDWTAKRIARIKTVAGTATTSNSGLRSANPSVAESTLIAGVSTPSPKSRLVPISTRIKSAKCFLDLGERMCSGINESNASIPPSPLLSARMTKVKYLSETTSIKAQKIMEAIPKI